MKGLVYTGELEEGIDLMLYKSYKTVHLSKIRPYIFKNTDDMSEDAQKYYWKLGVKLGFRPTDDLSELKQPSRFQLLKARRVDPMIVELDKEVTKSVDQAIDNSSDMIKDEVPHEVDHIDTTTEVVTESTNSNENYADMSDAELSEYLDMNYDTDQLKSIATTLGVNNNRRSKSNVINDLIGTKDELVKYLLNK